MLFLLFLSALLGQSPPAPVANVHFTVDAMRPRARISPYIYGVNQPDWKGATRDATLARIGGNRLTAYNWETNASNAGNDYHFQNDGFMGGGETPGEAMRPQIAAALNAGAAMIVTVPMAGYVSADKRGDGDVNKTPDYLNTRFDKSLPRKGRPFAFPPDLNDHTVYQDEFVAWVEKTFPQKNGPHRLFYSLDNEADLWDSTHARLRTQKLTYAEMLQRSIDYARAIKAVAPASLVFGPASFGWSGFENLTGATDANGRNFLDFYLKGMRDAGKTSGRRLLDVLDLHWYPEARGGGQRITEGGNEPDVVRARLQAPRSLWDATYQEDSWITRDVIHEPIRLLPRVKAQIAQFDPGMKLGITEYNYGGGNHISGAITIADVLGIFGREGVFAANYWQLKPDERFAYAAFTLYRNFDGKKGRFGDTSLAATTSDPVNTSLYASMDAAHPNRLVLVAINKTDAPIDADTTLAAKTTFRAARLYRLTGEAAQPRSAGETPVAAGNHLRLTLPPMSVTVIALQP